MTNSFVETFQAATFWSFSKIKAECHTNYISNKTLLPKLAVCPCSYLKAVSSMFSSFTNYLQSSYQNCFSDMYFWRRATVETSVYQKKSNDELILMTCTNQNVEHFPLWICCLLHHKGIKYETKTLDTWLVNLSQGTQHKWFHTAFITALQ